MAETVRFLEDQYTLLQRAFSANAFGPAANDDPLEEIRSIAKDPQNASLGARVCTSCRCIWCICTGEPEPDPEDLELGEDQLMTLEFLPDEELSQLPLEVRAVLGEIFVKDGSVSEDVLSYKALKILSQPGVFDNTPGIARMIAEQILMPAGLVFVDTSDESEGKLALAPGQTSFAARIQNLIHDGHPAKATDLLILAARVADPASLEYIGEIARAAAYEMAQIGRFDEFYSNEAALLIEGLKDALTAELIIPGYQPVADNAPVAKIASALPAAVLGSVPALAPPAAA